MYNYIDKKENQIFLIYKEIQSGAVAKSYMRKGVLMLHSEFSYVWGKFDFLFYQCIRAWQQCFMNKNLRCMYMHNLRFGSIKMLITTNYEVKQIMLRSRYYFKMMCVPLPVCYIWLYSKGIVSREYRVDAERLVRDGPCWRLNGNLKSTNKKEDGDSKSTNKKGFFLGWFVGLVMPVQEIFVLPWLL